MRELACEDNDGEPVSQQARDSFGFSFRPMAPKVLSVLQMSVLDQALLPGHASRPQEAVMVRFCP